MVYCDHGDGVPFLIAAVADDSYRNDAIGRTLAKMLRHREDKALDEKSPQNLVSAHKTDWS
jgi:hypothetical protein